MSWEDVQIPPTTPYRIDRILIDTERDLLALITYNDENGNKNKIEHHMSISADGREPTRDEINEALQFLGAKGNQGITGCYRFNGPPPGAPTRMGFHVWWK